MDKHNEDNINIMYGLFKRNNGELYITNYPGSPEPGDVFIEKDIDYHRLMEKMVQKRNFNTYEDGSVDSCYDAAGTY